MGNNNVESSNTYGRTTIGTLDYLQALTVSKEGELEMEIRTWRGTRWTVVFLHIDVGIAVDSTTRIIILLYSRVRVKITYM